MSVNSMKRTVQLGLLAKDIAASALRRKRGADAAAEGRRVVAARMAQLHGLPQKIGQILSLGELSNDVQPFTALTESLPVLPPETIADILEEEWGGGWRKRVRSFDMNGVSASLSQVHSAVLHDGRAVAVKIQYPGIAESVDLDLKALGWLTMPIGGLQRGFNIDAYQRELAARLSEELDYRHEATMLDAFGRWMDEDADVHVPSVVRELSNGKVLTMTWLTGKTFASVRHWPLADRRAIANTLLRIFLQSCFRWGMVHGDPHPGNYRFSRAHGAPVVGLLDFGCVKRLQPERMDALARLVRWTRRGDGGGSSNDLLSDYQAMGFDGMALLPLADLLAPLTRVLFEPFAAAGAFDPAKWRLGERAAEILGPMRWQLRIAGPADMTFFVRAYQGLVQYMKALNAPIEWARIFDEVCAAMPTKNQPPPLLSGPAPEARRTSKSANLRIRVELNGELRAALSFPAEAAARLSELIPPDTLRVLREREVDVDVISRDAEARSFEPGNLFAVEEAGRSIRVWLE